MSQIENISDKLNTAIEYLIYDIHHNLTEMSKRDLIPLSNKIR